MKFFRFYFQIKLFRFWSQIEFFRFGFKMQFSRFSFRWNFPYLFSDEIFLFLFCTFLLLNISKKKLSRVDVFENWCFFSGTRGIWNEMNKIIRCEKITIGVPAKGSYEKNESLSVPDVCRNARKIIGWMRNKKILERFPKHFW